MQMPIPWEQDSDREVLRAIQRGDPDALNELIRRTEGWVRGAVFTVLGDADKVEDVLQQVWMSVWERARHLDELNNWKGWLYCLARNAGIDARRRGRRWRNVLVNLRSHRGRAAREQDPSTELELTEQHQRALRAIRSLPERYRQVFVLRCLGDLGYRQIGEMLDLPVNTVTTRLVRARRMLREQLNREG